ncbi:hypothetical protein RND81_02G112700 [Saponaria officinalis]|uniref:Gnk2-homologous domain-containing protein n=1 Tax=Saponaria officinalis TaxID=3572 RepID=A0AAW1MS09_SAPOF
MLNNNNTIIFLLLLLILLHQLPLFTPTNAYIFIYAGCSQQKYQPSSSYEPNLNSLLTSLVSSSSQTLYNNFSANTPPVYALYQCRGDLTLTDCSSCIHSAVSQVGLVCPYSYGATLQLEGCYIRYEQFDFVGLPDLTVMYKRCSRSNGVDDNGSGVGGEFLSRRDEVLGALESGDGFRVSRAGSVQGFGQCMGDLSGSDCSACLSEAVKELKLLCGSAAAAHVYLAKCFAQYWADGYYDLSTGGVSDPTHEDDVSKTIAIIVGIIGGIAVLIVLLSLCRRSCGGPHGGGK